MDDRRRRGRRGGRSPPRRPSRSARRRVGWTSSPCSARCADAGHTRRRGSTSRYACHGAGACGHPLRLVVALGEVRRDGQAELEAGRVELGRARVRRMRRDAEARRGRRTLAADPLPVRLEAGRRAPRSSPEDLEVDDRAQPELGRPRRRRAGEARVADGRDARARGTPRRQGGRRRRRRRSRAARLRCMCSSSQRAERAARRRSRRRPRTRGGSAR